MALVTPSAGSGDFSPIVKYDARAGRIFRVEKDDSGSTPVDITRTFKALFDFEQVEVGYILFAIGGAPDFHMVPYGSAMPQKPGNDHKQGIRMKIKLAPSCGGDDPVRELAGTSNAFLRGINAVHDEYLKLAPANPGKLPVITLQDTIAVESGGGQKKSTNYQPVFTIAGWAPRPADMPLQQAAAAAPASATKSAPPAASVPPAARAAAPAAAMADAGADDFGD